MSKISTLSVFYYGTKVTRDNRALDFSEGGPEIQASLNLGDYSLQDFASEIQRALRLAGSLSYTVTANRTTRQITIAAGSNFSLLSNTGTRKDVAIWLLAGISTLTDHTGAATYTGSLGAGFEYKTQHPVSNYVSETDFPTRESATFTVTPSGIGQMISFADSARIQMDIRLITNLTLNNSPFYINASGINDAKNFMKYLIDKNKVEFMADASNRVVYSKIFLESTREDKDGYSYILKNMNAPDIYHTGVLTFRKVI
jgi:hypothetical protein